MSVSAVFRETVAVRAGVALEVPGVGGVAPAAGEVAARQADEGAGLARRGAFALERGEDLGLARSGGGED